MKNVNLESAIKKYNSIMVNIGYEHNTIGTKFSEDTEKWNEKCGSLKREN